MAPKITIFLAFDEAKGIAFNPAEENRNPHGRTPETGVVFIVFDELPTKNHPRPGTAKPPLLHLATQSLKYKSQSAKSE